jgi:hypothetical protein
MMDTLPTEILCDIINRVSTEDSGAVLSLSKTNRRLHLIANEVIYKGNFLDIGDYDPGLFIRALASSPKLQRCVEFVDWNEMCDGIHDFSFPAALTAAEFQHISEIVGFDLPAQPGGKKMSMGEKVNRLNEWLAGRKEEDDRYLTTFLLFTPRVKSLEVETQPEWSTGMWLKQSLESKICTNLRNVYLSSVRILNILPLFLLPTMRSVVIWALSHAPQESQKDAESKAIDAAWERLEREGSNVERLELESVETDMLDLARVLRSFKSLTHFGYTFDDYGRHRTEGCNEHVQTLLETIGTHRESLRELRIDEDRLATNQGALKELRGLDKVESLQMFTPVFYANRETHDDTLEVLAESLPRNLGNLPKHLKHLRLSAIEDYWDITEHLLDVLLTLAPIIKTILPDLENITFFGWHPQLGTFPCQTRIAALQSAFAPSGVEIVSEHDIIGFANEMYKEFSVGASTKIEEDYDWVQILTGDDHYNDDPYCPWLNTFGSFRKGNELPDTYGHVADESEYGTSVADFLAERAQVLEERSTWPATVGEEDDEEDDDEEDDSDSDDDEEDDGDEDESDEDDLGGSGDEDDAPPGPTPDPNAPRRLNMQDIVDEMRILAARGPPGGSTMS